MAKAKGSKKVAGRAKGTPNKLSQTVKECFEIVFAEAQHGNSKIRLKQWAKENPTDFYKICSKLIPASVDVTSKGESIAPPVIEIIAPNG